LVKPIRDCNARNADNPSRFGPADTVATARRIASDRETFHRLARESTRSMVGSSSV